MQPNEQEKYSYIDWGRTKLYTWGTISLAALIAGMVLFLRVEPWFAVFLPVMGLTAVYLLVSYLVVWTSSPFSLALHKYSQKVTDGPGSKNIDVLYPTSGEPIETIVEALRHIVLARDSWNPQNKIWVLDDSGREEVALVARTLGVEYVTRPNKGEGKKAGNLLYVWPRLEADFFAIFDADFCPREDFFQELMPSFNHSKVAIVQSPQFFRVEGNWVSKGAAQVQELFYRIIQVARNHWGAPICVGTNAIYRKSAFPQGTYQIPYSEDVHTGWDAQARGYWVQYVPLNLAAGECPRAVQNFFYQQYRWAMGSLSLASNINFWRSPIGVLGKLCYSCGFGYYLATGLAVLIDFLPSLAVLIWRPDMFKWWNYAFVLPSLLFSTVGIALWSRSKWGIYSLMSRRISSGAHLLAIIDKLSGKIIPWQPTGGAVSKSWKFYAWLTFQWAYPCLMVAVLMTIGLSTVGFSHMIPTLFTGALHIFLAGTVLYNYARHG